MIVKYLSAILLVTSARLCIGYILPTGEVSNGKEQNLTLSGDDICDPRGGPKSFCQSCLQSRYRDYKKCIWNALEGDLKIPISFQIPNSAGQSLSRDVTKYRFAVDTDLCTKLRWAGPVGPFQFHNRKHTNVALNVIVQSLSSLSAENAMAVVLENARQGLEEVKAKFPPHYHTEMAGGLSGLEELQANWTAANIKLLDAFIFQAIGGSATWLTVSAWARAGSGPEPSPSQDLINGAVATMALLTYLAIIDWLKNGLEKPLLMASAHWVFWLIQCAVSSMRLMLQIMPRLGSRVNNPRIIGTLRRLPRYPTIELIGPLQLHSDLVLPNIRVHEPDTCHIHITPSRPSTQPKA